MAEHLDALLFMLDGQSKNKSPSNSERTFEK
jgi:hypothetical protein